MTLPDYLPGGSVRFRGNGCAFLFSRVRPGVLLTCIEGFDRGDLGSAPLDEVQHESRRFRRPLDWFLDATAAENAASPVFQEWVRWLAQHRNIVKSVSMLTATQPMRLTAAMAQHMSGLGTAMTLYTDRAAFEQAIGSEYRPFPPGWADLPSVAHEVQRSGAGAVVRGGSSVWTFSYPSRHALMARIQGSEDGDLRNVHLDEAEAMLATRETPRSWYIDMRDVSTVSPRLVDEWSAWLSARQGDLSRVHVVPPRGAAGLLLEISSARERLGNMLTVHNDTVEFDTAVQQSRRAGA